jgi:hypothetical protein
MSQDPLLDWLAKGELNVDSALRRSAVLEAATEALVRTQAEPGRRLLRLTGATPGALACVTLFGAVTCTRGLLSLLECFRPELVLLGLLPLGAIVPAIGALFLMRTEKTTLADARIRSLLFGLLARRVPAEAALRTAAAVTRRSEGALRGALGLGPEERADSGRILETGRPSWERGQAFTRAQALCIVAVTWASLSFWSLYVWSMSGTGLER